MGSPTRESGLVHQITQALVDEYPTAVVWKMHGSIYMETGIPDLLACVEGRFIGIEVKHIKPGESRQHALGRVTVRQHRQIERLQAAGGTSGVATSVEEALEIVRSSR